MGSGSRQPRRKEQERWPYNLDDITELIHYHLVLAEDDNQRADANLARLAGEIERMATQPLWRPTEWIFCDDCGCAVDMELIDPDGHHYADDGDFYCVDCWGSGEIGPPLR